MSLQPISPFRFLEMPKDLQRYTLAKLSDLKEVALVCREFYHLVRQCRSASGELKTMRFTVGTQEVYWINRVSSIVKLVINYHSPSLPKMLVNDLDTIASSQSGPLITHLELSANDDVKYKVLSDAVGEQLAKFPSLRYVWMSHLRMMPSVLSRMRQVTHLYLSNCQSLRRDAPLIDIIGELTELKEVECLATEPSKENILKLSRLSKLEILRLGPPERELSLPRRKSMLEHFPAIKEAPLRPFQNEILELCKEQDQEKFLRLITLINSAKVDAVSTDIFKVLDRGPFQHNILELIFFAALKQNYHLLIAKLLDSGININKRSEKSGFTPLYYALNRAVKLAENSSDFDKVCITIDLLLEKRADPNIATRDGRLPLFLGLCSNSMFLIEKLLKAPIHPDLKLEMHCHPMWELFREAKIPYQERGNSSYSPLQAAYYVLQKLDKDKTEDYDEVVGLLIDRGADLKVLDDDKISMRQHFEMFLKSIPHQAPPEHLQETLRQHARTSRMKLVKSR